VDLSDNRPKALVFGRLRFITGFSLSSSDRRFGGLSGIWVSSHEMLLHAISDRGHWITAHMHHDRDGKLTGFDEWEIHPMLGIDGSPLMGPMSDAEALTQDKDGTLLVSFERHHRIWRYRPPPDHLISPATLAAVPRELEDAPSNSGLEALTVLDDGSLLAITEDFRNADESVKAWVMGGEGFYPLSYLPSFEFDPTDAATLPNGDVLVLERRFSWLSWFSIKIKRIVKDSIKPNAVIVGDEIAELRSHFPLDNFEALAVRQDGEGRIFVYLASDDNFSSFQKTLFFQFEFLPEK